MKAALVAEPGGTMSAAPISPEHSLAVDRRGFSELYQQTATRVFRYAWSIVRDDSLAEDITAEVYLRAWRSRGSFRGDAAPLSWLLTITRNCAISELRDSRRREAAVIDRNLTADTVDDPETAALQQADVILLSDALGRLTEEQRQIIFLRFFEGLKHDEIGELLGKKATAVRAAQFRALTQLRRILESQRE